MFLLTKKTLKKLIWYYDYHIMSINTINDKKCVCKFEIRDNANIFSCKTRNFMEKI